MKLCALGHVKRLVQTVASFTVRMFRNYCHGQTCSGRGSCNNGASSYSCSCHTGYSGGTCQNCATTYVRESGVCVVNYCYGRSCSGFGSCNNHASQNRYSCSCNTGYSG